jgi:hypothetical protein
MVTEDLRDFADFVLVGRDECYCVEPWAARYCRVERVYLGWLSFYLLSRW